MTKQIDGIREKLERLAVLRTKSEELAESYEDQNDKTVAEFPDLQKRLDELETDFRKDHDALADEMDPLDKQIREEVIKLGHSVSSTSVEAIYTKGRVSWDHAALEGVLAMTPQIGKFKTVGKPSVMIRRVKT